MKPLQNIRIATLQIALFVACAGHANAEDIAKETGERPNIVLILADDFGWGDASCNNPNAPLKTPAIDRIARLTNAHTPSSLCTPTRYGLLTGRYPWRSYLKKEVLSYYAPAMITKDRTTIASPRLVESRSLNRGRSTVRVLLPRSKEENRPAKNIFIAGTNETGAARKPSSSSAINATSSMRTASSSTLSRISGRRNPWTPKNSTPRRPKPLPS